MALSREQILKIAKLAKLDLTDSEVELYMKNLTDILAYVDQLQEIDTTNTAITSQVTGLEHVVHEDSPEKKWDVFHKNIARELLDCSPLPTDGNQIKVPKVLE